MEQEMVEILIEKTMQRIDYKWAKTVRKLVIFIFALYASVLLAIKNYVFTAILFILMVSEFIYVTKILKKGIMSLYSGVGLVLIFIGQVVLMLDIWVYGFQKLMGVYEPVLLTVILVIEAVCLIAGFLYTQRCVKNRTVRRTAMPATVSGIVAGAGALGYYFSEYIITKTPISVQNVILTMAFSFTGAILMFATGMYHLAILHYIKKLRIPDRELK